jgi:hypothetical protein
MQAQGGLSAAPEGQEENSPAAVLILRVFLCGYFLFAGGCSRGREGFEPMVHVDKKLTHDRGQSRFAQFTFGD